MLNCPVVRERAFRLRQRQRQESRDVRFLETDEDKAWWEEHKSFCLLCLLDDIDYWVRRFQSRELMVVENAGENAGEAVGAAGDFRISMDERHWLKWHLLKLSVREGREILGSLQRATPQQVKAIAKQLSAERGFTK